MDESRSVSFGTPLERDESLQGKEAVYDFFRTILFQPEEICPETIMALELNGVFLGDGSFCLTQYAINFEAEAEQSAAGTRISRRSRYLALEELVRQKMAFSCINYTLHLGGTVVNIACFPHGVQGMESTFNMLSHIVSEVYGEFLARQGMRVTAALCGVEKGIASLSGMYFRSREMLRFRQFMELEPPVLLSDAEVLRDRKTDFDMPMFASCASQLRRAIQSRSPEQMQQVHRYAIEFIVGTGDSMPQQVLLRTESYMAMVLQHLIDANILTTEETRQYDLTARIMACSTQRRLLEETSAILEELYRRAMASSLAQNINIRISDIKDYIGEKITNPGLSVQDIADHFGMTNSALSLCFKRSCCQNISEYIQRRRLDNARRLLADESLSLERVSQLVGYGSATTMYRAFKKYLGTTPGDCRSAMAAADETMTEISDAVK